MGVIIRAAVMYVVILAVLRISTRRVMRTATPFDMVLIFVFGGLSVQAVMQDEKSVTASLLAVATFSLIHIALVRLKLMLPVVGKLVEGTPVVVYENGQWKDQLLIRQRFDRRDVISEARQKGLGSMAAVDKAIIEHTGGITLIPKKPG